MPARSGVQFLSGSSVKENLTIDSSVAAGSPGKASMRLLTYTLIPSKKCILGLPLSPYSTAIATVPAVRSASPASALPFNFSPNTK